MCPECGTPYNKEGFTIPFETFLGFEANKEPDIDLNFAGEYQGTAQKYVEEIFGERNESSKPGPSVPSRTRRPLDTWLKYFEEEGSMSTDSRWTGSHPAPKESGKRQGSIPAGIIIVPEGHEIYEFCPVQHPANDVKSDIITTHFDYHSIDQNLLKLDILGHDAPSMIRQLQDMTGVDPTKVPDKGR